MIWHWPRKITVHLLLASGLLAGSVQAMRYAETPWSSDQNATQTRAQTKPSPQDATVSDPQLARNQTFGTEKLQHDNVQVSDPPSLHGYVVENPIAYAPVAIYEADTFYQDCFNERAPLTITYTDAQAHFANLSTPTNNASLFIVVADSSRGRDQVSGAQPVFQRLITVATAQQFSEPTDVVISPVTTLAFYSVMTHCGEAQDVESLRAAFDDATNVIADNFPALSAAGARVLTEPPLLNDSKLTPQTLQQRLAHRVITQGIGAIVMELTAANQDTALTSDGMLRLMAADIAHDGQFDGYDGETQLRGIDSAVYARTLGTLHAQDGNAPLSDVTRIAQADALIYGASVTIDADDLPSTLDAEAPLMRVAYAGHNFPTDIAPENIAHENSDRYTTPAGIATQHVQLHWDASDTAVSGYEIFVVNNATDTKELIKSLRVDTPGFNLLAPSADVELPTTWKIAGDQPTCFQIRAFNEAGASELSEPVCGMI